MIRLRSRCQPGRIHRSSTLRGRLFRRSYVPVRWVPVADYRCGLGRRTRCGRVARWSRCRRHRHRAEAGLPLRSTQRHRRRLLRGPRDTDCRWSRHHWIDWTDVHVRDEGGVDGVRSCHSLGQKVILVRVARSSSRSLPRVIERNRPMTAHRDSLVRIRSLRYNKRRAKKLDV